MADYSTYDKAELLKIIAKQEKELKKKYGLVWDSEREPEQVVLDCENNLPILKQIKNKEIRTDDSEYNILIEGDNYHALTVLNYTHKEKVDVIYIDPPYNTGKKDFIYNDRYVDKEDSYKHSKWLNFMEKRLNLAKELLKKTGVIFISIDDNEFAQLKLLCDKIFGKDNFIANIIIQSNPRGKQQMKIAVGHEYLLVYGKDIENVNFKDKKLSDEQIRQYNKINSDGNKYREMGLRKRGAASRRIDVPNLFYPIFINPKTGQVSLREDNIFTKKAIPQLGNGEDGRWRWGKKKFELEKNKLFGRVVNKKRWDVFEKDYLSEDKLMKFKSVWIDKELNYENAKREIKEIFNGNSSFDYPKTIFLINRCLYIACPKNGVALDFMAGSGTTGQAVLELNKKDGGNRKFILCTNNELNGVGSKLAEKNLNKDNEEFGICQRIAYPRLKKVIKGYKKNGNGIFVDGLGGNLQYFKTALIKKTKNRDQVKINLTKKCTEMLCVKENIFNLEIEEKDYKIFSSNKTDKFLCIYYNFIEDSFENFLDELKTIKSKKIIYMFSMKNEVDKTLFSEISNKEIEAIPQEILTVYQQLVKMNIPIKTNVIFTDLNKAKNKIFTDKDKNDGARVLRIVLEKLIQKISQDNSIHILNAKGKEEKISVLNDKLYNQNIITKVEYVENRAYMTIGNNAAHGDYDDYDLKQVEKFYKHIQSLLNSYNT